MEKELVKLKNEKFNDVTFLDFNDFPLSNREFGDFTHVNYRGAKIFSLWFDVLLEKGLLTDINVNDSIKKYIELQGVPGTM